MSLYATTGNETAKAHPGIDSPCYLPYNFQMAIDDFLFELPDLQYDKEYLQEYCRSVYRSELPYPLQWPQQTFGMTWVPLHNKETERIRRVLSIPLKGSYMCVFKPQSQSGFHTDPERGGTLILPVSDDLHIQLKEDDDTVIDHVYNQPLITNALRKHNAVNRTSADRINVLFHFAEPFEKLKDMYRTGALMKTSVDQTQNYYRCLSIVDNSDAFGEKIRQVIGGDLLESKDLDKESLSRAENYDLLVTDQISLVTALKNLCKPNGKVIFVGTEECPLSDIQMQTQRRDAYVIDTLKWRLDQPQSIRMMRLE